MDCIECIIESKMDDILKILIVGETQNFICMLLHQQSQLTWGATPNCCCRNCIPNILIWVSEKMVKESIPNRDNLQWSISGILQGSTLSTMKSALKYYSWMDRWLPKWKYLKVSELLAQIAHYKRQKSDKTVREKSMS